VINLAVGRFAAGRSFPMSDQMKTTERNHAARRRLVYNMRSRTEDPEDPQGRSPCVTRCATTPGLSDCRKTRPRGQQIVPQLHQDEPVTSARIED